MSSEKIVTISTLCYNNAEMTNKFLKMLYSTIPQEGVEVILVNNGSSDNTEGVIFSSNLNNKIYLPFGINLGFPRGHNEALKYANGKYFICLNNDITFRTQNWVKRIIEPLEQDERIAIVGLQGEYCTLKQDGMAIRGESVDYADGGCIAGRTELYRKYGLFSKSIDMFYYEDSDLSLRYRQMGYKVALIKLDSEHLRGSTLRTIDPDYKRYIINKNSEVFKKRWGGYLKNKMFNNIILLKMFSHGAGDIICMTPILEAIAQDHPTAKIELETGFPEVFANNPFTKNIFGVRHSYQHGYDRVIDINPNYAKYGLIVEEAEKIAGTRVLNKRPRLYMSNSELKWGQDIVNSLKKKSDDIVVTINLQLTRSNWSGRCWSLREAKRLVEMMNEVGIKTIEVGKNISSVECATKNMIDKTTLRQLFSLIGCSDAFIGIDSMCFHVAQAFGKQSFIIFGATEPISRVVDFTTTFPIRLSELPCIGCYQKKGKSTYNHCNLGTEECMNKLTAETVFSYITGKINPMEENTKYLQEYMRGRHEN